MNCEHLKYDLSVEVLTRGRHPLTATVVTHLEFCPECRHVYEDLKETAKLLSLLGQNDDVPGDAPLPMPAQSPHPSGRTVTVRRKPRGSAAPLETGPTRCVAHWLTEPSGPPRAHRP